MTFFPRLTAFFRTRRLFLAIAAAITIALVLTLISLKLYDMDDVSRLDVSLPNRENIRPSTSSDSSQKFEAFGPLDAQAYSDFQSMYSTSRATLDKLGKFDDNSLEDTSLKISVSQ